MTSTTSNYKSQSMNKIFELAGYELSVDFEPQLVRVYSNLQLWKFLNGDVGSRMQLLAGKIKAEYAALFGKRLNISTESLIIEILVHVYCDYLGLLFNRFVKIKWMQRIVIRLLKRAEVVDCGEHEVDSNRWIWNLFSRFNKVFIYFMPGNLNYRKLK